MILIISLQFTALVCLFLSMYKHYNETFNKPPKTLTSRSLKTLGWVLMMVSLALVLNINAISFIYWLSFLSLEILIIATINCFKNKP